MQAVAIIACHWECVCPSQALSAHLPLPGWESPSSTASESLATTIGRCLLTYNVVAHVWDSECKFARAGPLQRNQLWVFDGN